MKTIKAAAGFVITQPDESNFGDETARVQSARDILTFKGISLEELLRKAAELQSLIALSMPWDIYELYAKYDIETREWTGRLCEIA